MHRRFFAPALALLATTHMAAAATDADSLTTASERSGFKVTGRYEEVGELCRAFAATFPAQVSCFSFGTTPEGRELWALAASADGVVTPEKARAAGRPVILAQGGIHSGEIDGKDAGFLVLRELLTDRRNGEVLRKVTFVFVPVFSADGHERFGRWNRPNQTGPEEMGWRTTAQNYNLNRDYSKADAPEMQAMHRLLNAWDPAVYVDLHVTDGAQFEHDVAILSEPREGGDREVAVLADRIRDTIIARIASQGSTPLAFYPAFNVNDDPGSGVNVTPAPPRFSTGYWGLSNRVALLVETHSWKDYPTRVRVTANILRALLDSASRDAGTWQATMQSADARAGELAGSTYPLAFDVTDDVRWVDFKGYAYTRTPSEVSGKLMTRYDTKRPAVWRMPVKDHVRTVTQADVPGGGYLVPPSVATWLAPKLKDHGIRYEKAAANGTPVNVQAWRASSASIAPQTFEGHPLFKLKGAWANESQVLPPGTLYVPIAQPKARLVLALLEPEAPDSYAAWGFFATSFEKKEYMEPYVAEEVAREMLKADPQLKREFEQQLATDKKFADDPDARLEFFYSKHDSWDERYNLYPIYRVDRAP
ncbi:MAG TPA: M14 family zinc carboxypeptidase [Steroidobacteraceae bacterium]|nr:M14 family zinc carboxypeptidase [Steroidobacteraceae bacterium]